jgi:hypothetical protein
MESVSWRLLPLRSSVTAPASPKGAYFWYPTSCIPAVVHGPGQSLDRFAVSPSPCSRGPLPVPGTEVLVGEGIQLFTARVIVEICLSRNSDPSPEGEGFTDPLAGTLNEQLCGELVQNTVLLQLSRVIKRLQ